MKKRIDQEPDWEPLPRLAPVPAALIVARNAIPVVGGTVPADQRVQHRVQRHLHRDGRRDGLDAQGAGNTGPVVEANDWLIALPSAVLLSLFLIAMFGWVVAVIAVSTGHPLFTPSLGWAAFTMIAASRG